MEYTNTNPNTELAYDLRQIYAKIVGEHLLDATEARKANDLYTWYKTLEDLHTVIKHKFKSPDDEKDFNTLRNKATSLANKYPSAWVGVSKNDKDRAEIEEALRQLEEFLYAKMSEAKMFGDTWRVAGL